MGANKKYSGYKSYEFLGPSRFSLIQWASELAWEGYEPYEVPLSPEEEERYKKTIEDNIIISLHEHLVTLPKNMKNPLEVFSAFGNGRNNTAYEALSKSCLDAVIDNGGPYLKSTKGATWGEAVFNLGMRLCDIEHQDYMIQCKRIEDIYRAHDEGKIAFIPSYEMCTMIETELDRLDVLYGLGIRMLGITYSEANLLGSGLAENKDAGLTRFGYQVVERMNKLGIAIDTAHCGDRTTLDVIEASDKPVSISHAGARSVWDTDRMKPDEVIVACAEKGGIIGIEAAPSTTPSDAHPGQGIESFFDHLNYCIDLVGIDHVGFGPDTFYGDHCGLHNLTAQMMSMDAFKKKGGPEVERAPFIKGLENPTESANNIVRYLVKSGFSDEDITKIVGGNALRVLKAAWE